MCLPTFIKAYSSPFLFDLIHKVLVNMYANLYHVKSIHGPDLIIGLVAHIMKLCNNNVFLSSYDREPVPVLCYNTNTGTSTADGGIQSFKIRFDSVL